MGRIIILLNIGLLCFLLFSCKNKKAEKAQLLATTEVNFEDTSKFDGLAIVDSSNTKNRCSKINKAMPFGAGTFFVIPDAALNKNIRVIIKAKVRADHTRTFNHFFAVSMNNGESQLFWTTLDIDPNINKSGEWCVMEDSTQISSKINCLRGSIVKIFGFNGSDKDYIDYDDMQIQLKEID